MKKMPQHYSVPFPPAKTFIMTFMENPNTHIEYPTFSASYLGQPVEEYPDPEILSMIEAVSLDFAPTEDERYGEIVLRAFHTPANDLIGFARSMTYKLTVDIEPAKDFMRKVEEHKQFMIFINTEYFRYFALVDLDSGHLDEGIVEYRLIN